MTISAIEIQDKSDDDMLRQHIFSFGAKGQEIWKSAVKTDKALFDKIFQFIFTGDKRLAWRSCWIIDTASEEYPEIIADKLPKIISSLLITKDGSLKRHFTRILSRYEIPEEYLGPIINRCFELLGPSEAPAVRVNAMQVLFNIAQQIPELRGELSSVIENLMEEGGSVGFMNRSAKILNLLQSQ